MVISIICMKIRQSDDPRITTLSSNIKKMLMDHKGTKWRIIKSRTNRKTHDINTVISFYGTIISATVSKDKMQLRRHLQKLSNSSIKLRGKKLILQYALGPGNKAPIMLKHLGLISIAYVTRLMNLSMSVLSIPSLWIIDRIFSTLKPINSSD